MSFVSNYTSILDNRRKKISAKVGLEGNSEYLKYMTKRSGAERITTDIGITGLAQASFVSDGGIAAFDAPIQGFEKNFTQQHLQKNAVLSYEAYYFLFKSNNAKKIDSELQKRIMNLRDVMEQTKEYYAQNFLAQGWNTSFSFTPLGNIAVSAITVNSTGADGVEFWSQSHPREDGGAVWTNVIVDGVTPSPALSMAAIEAAHQIHSQKKDGRGAPMNSKLDKLVVVDGSAAHQEAKRIKSVLDRGYYPAANPQTSGSFMDAPRVPSFEIVTIKNYGSDGVDGNSWFMFDSEMMNEDYGFQYIEAMPNTIVDLPMPLNRDYIFGIDSFFTIGGNDMRGWMASAGDDTTS